MKDLQKQSSKQKKMSYARLLGVISEQSAVEVAVYVFATLIPDEISLFFYLTDLQKFKYLYFFRVKSFLSTVIDLSRDPIPEVRGTMCLQYPAIVESMLHYNMR